MYHEHKSTPTIYRYMTSDAGLLIAGVIGLVFIILIYVEIKNGNEKNKNI